MNRIVEKFAALKRDRKKGFIVYIGAGDPNLDATRKLALAFDRDGVDVLHTIGGDDTNTAAADLAAFLARNNYGLTVIGLPKTIDNDVYPIKQSLGAWTAAEHGANYFWNVVAESANHFIRHEPEHVPKLCLPLRHPAGLLEVVILVKKSVFAVGFLK